MGLWTGTVDFGLTSGRVILVCSVSMRPLPIPCFDSEAAADGFCLFARQQGCDDVRRLSYDELETMYERWVKSGAPEVHEDDDEPTTVTPLQGSDMALECGRRAARVADEALAKVRESGR